MVAKRNVAVISMSDGRERVHEGLLPVIAAHQKRLVDWLEASGEAHVACTLIVHSQQEARSAMAELRRAAAEALIVCQPVFGFPHNAVAIIRDLGLPTLLFAPWEPAYPALVGVLTIGGGLTEVGIAHRRLWGRLEDPEIQRQLLAFVRGGGAVTALRGRRIGQMGGRSMGLYTTAADGAMWQRQFGVDLDHCDQSEIVRRAEAMPRERVATGVGWLMANLRCEFDQGQLTEAKLASQVRSYLATKDIVTELGWDALALKCHYEMSEFQVAQCLTPAFLSEPADWEGEKQAVPTSCEADADGALTMLAMQLATGRTAALMDIRFYDRAKEVYVLSNCGAAPVSFAAAAGAGREEALARVTLCPCTAKYLGGGAHVRFVFSAGEMTLARLSRDEQGYRMLIAKGEALDLPLEQVEGASTIWPHAFIRLAIRPQELVETLQANHLHLVQGDYVRELDELCRFSGVRAVHIA